MAIAFADTKKSTVSPLYSMREVDAQAMIGLEIMLNIVDRMPSIGSDTFSSLLSTLIMNRVPIGGWDTIKSNFNFPFDAILTN